MTKQDLDKMYKLLKGVQARRHLDQEMLDELEKRIEQSDEHIRVLILAISELRQV